MMTAMRNTRMKITKAHTGNKAAAKARPRAKANTGRGSIHPFVVKEKAESHFTAGRAKAKEDSARGPSSADGPGNTGNSQRARAGEQATKSPKIPRNGKARLTGHSQHRGPPPKPTPRKAGKAEAKARARKDAASVAANGIAKMIARSTLRRARATQEQQTQAMVGICCVLKAKVSTQSTEQFSCCIFKH